MSTTTEQLVAEAGLPADAVIDLEPVVSALRELTPDTAPTPSPALAALLAAPPRPALPRVPRSRRRLAVLGSAAAVLSSLTVTGVAAAANELPDPAQRFVAELSERYLPFHFPQPRNGATKVDPDETPERVAPADPGIDPDPTAPVGSPAPSADSSGLPTPSEVPSGRPSEPGASPSSPGTPSGEPTPSEAPSSASSGAPSGQPSGTLAPAPADSDGDLTDNDPRVGTDPDAEPTAEPSAPASSAGSDPTADPTADATSDPTADASEEPTGDLSDEPSGAGTSAG